MKKFFLILFLLGACKEENRVPAGIISEARMVDILIQMHIAEAKVSVRNLTPDSAFKYFHYLEANIYNKFKVDSSSFKKSFKYYSEEGKRLDNIYTTVIDSLSLRESRKMIQ